MKFTPTYKLLKNKFSNQYEFSNILYYDLIFNWYKIFNISFNIYTCKFYIFCTRLNIYKFINNLVSDIINS